MKEGKQTIPYKSKVAYELVFLEAIKDCRKQRVNDPGRGFINAVRALEIALFPNEKEKIDSYKLDSKIYSDEVKQIRDNTSFEVSQDLRESIILNEIKKLSWPEYIHHLKKGLDEKCLPNIDFEDNYDKTSVQILAYEALLEKIIDVLKEGDWLIKGADLQIGGGGYGLDD